MESLEILQTLRGQIVENIGRLAPEQVAQLEDLDRLIADFNRTKAPEPVAVEPEVREGEFANLQVIAAATLYLNRVRKPVTMEHLLNMLVRGGVTVGAENRKQPWLIQQCLNFAVTKGLLSLQDVWVTPRVQRLDW